MIFLKFLPNINFAKDSGSDADAQRTHVSNLLKMVKRLTEEERPKLVPKIIRTYIDQGRDPKYIRESGNAALIDALDNLKSASGQMAKEPPAVPAASSSSSSLPTPTPSSEEKTHAQDVKSKLVSDMIAMTNRFPAEEREELIPKVISNYMQHGNDPKYIRESGNAEFKAALEEYNQDSKNTERSSSSDPAPYARNAASEDVSTFLTKMGQVADMKREIKKSPDKTKDIVAKYGKAGLDLTFPDETEKPLLIGMLKSKKFPEEGKSHVVTEIFDKMDPDKKAIIFQAADDKDLEVLEKYGIKPDHRTKALMDKNKATTELAH